MDQVNTEINSCKGGMLKMLKKIWNSIKIYRTNSIYYNGFIKIVLPIMLLMILLTIIVFNLLQSSFEKETEYNLEKFNQVYVDMADDIFKQGEKIVKNISVDENVQNYIVLGSNNLLLKDNLQKLKTILSSYKIVNDYIDSIYIYSEKNQQIFVDDANISVERCDDMNWVELIDDNNIGNIQFVSRVKSDIYPNLISVAKIVEVSGCRGVIVLNINAEKIDELTGIHGNAEKYIIKNKKILYSNNFEVSERYIKNDEQAEFLFEGSENEIVKHKDGNLFFIKSDSSIFNWSYVYVEDLSMYTENSRIILMVIVVLILIILIVIFFIVNTTMTELYGHVNILENVLGENVDKKILDSSSEELKKITQKILIIIDMNTNIKEELSKNVKQLNETKIKTLQMQINPHFLYNSLNAIYMQTVDDFTQKHKSSQMVLKLSELLSGYLDIDRDIVTIREEIKYSKIYIDFMNERYDHICQIKWDIDESFYDYIIPKFTLQPILENAFYHGIVCNIDKSNGVVSIRTYVKEKYIYFEVIDNGMGIPEEKLKEICNGLSDDNISYENKHIGLKNVNTRLKLLFDSTCGISIESKYGSYTKITVKLLILQDSTE